MVRSPAEAALEVRPSIPFVGDVDDEARARAIPDDHRLRGMFFARCAGDLGSLEGLTLREPPAMGRYLPFVDYPTADYMRVFGAAARRVHPAASAREAWRKYAREEIASFSSTILGKVSLSLLGDPTAALLRYPEVFRSLVQGPVASASKLDERAVRIELRNAHAPIEYAIGVFEGLVMMFKRHPRIDVTSRENTHVFDVRWMI